MNKEEYYLNPENRKKLINLWFNRELCTIPNEINENNKIHRHFSLFNLNYWDLIAKQLLLYAENRNMFYTSAKFSFLPNKCLGKNFFNQWVFLPNECYNKILKGHIMSYDLLLDFDFNSPIGEYENYLEELDNFLLILHINKVKYIKSQSSVKIINGVKIVKYHITLPYEILKLPFDFENNDGDVLIYYKNLLLKIKEVFKLKFLCTALAGVYNRVQKSPLTVYDEFVLSYEIFNEHYGQEEFKAFYIKYLKGE